MAHVAKFKASASGHMMSHYDRSKKNISGNIDWNKTADNYNLGPDRDLKQLDFLHQRLSEIKVQKRADVNVFCDWVVTLPKEQMIDDEWQKAEYSREEVRSFFEESYEFLREKYGEKNVISAYVHMDETQPHMHFAFVPAVPDQRWNEKHPEQPREKLSAKECVTQIDLKVFHTELQRHMDEKFGQDKFAVLNGATWQGNLTVAELRAEQKTQEICSDLENLEYEKTSIQMEVKDANKTLKSVQESVQNAQNELEGLLGQIDKEKADLGLLNDKKEKLQSVTADLQNRIDDLQSEVGDLQQEKEVREEAIKKLDIAGTARRREDWWADVATTRADLSIAQEQSLLAKFAQWAIDQFPAIKDLYEKFKQSEQRPRKKKKMFNHENHE